MEDPSETNGLATIVESNLFLVVHSLTHQCPPTKLGSKWAIFLFLLFHQTTSQPQQATSINISLITQHSHWSFWLLVFSHSPFRVCLEHTRTKWKWMKIQLDFFFRATNRIWIQQDKGILRVCVNMCHEQSHGFMHCNDKTKEPSQPTTDHPDKHACTTGNVLKHRW